MARKRTNDESNTLLVVLLPDGTSWQGVTVATVKRMLSAIETHVSVRKDANAVLDADELLNHIHEKQRQVDNMIDMSEQS